MGHHDWLEALWKNENEAVGGVGAGHVPLLDQHSVLPVKLFRSVTARGRAAVGLRMWAVQADIEIVALKACGRPPDSVLEQFPHMSLPGPDQLAGGAIPTLWPTGFRYFQITIIDADHVRRAGIARVQNEARPWVDAERVIDFVWFTSEQLNWMDRPPRRSAVMPRGRAEGWYTDHTGAHELRWYSVGTPTNLVKDGAVESRDPPRPLTALPD